MHRLLRCFVLALCAASMIGCNSKRTVTTSDGQEVTVSGEGQEFEMTFSDESGQPGKVQVSEKGLQVPSDWPEDVGTLENLKIIVATSTPDGHMMAMESAQSPKQVYDYYLQQLTEDGWEIKVKTETLESIMLSANKGERNVNVMSSKDDGKTVVNLIVGG